MTHALLEPSAIHLGLRATDRFDAVAQAGKALLDIGAVDEPYLEAQLLSRLLGPILANQLPAEEVEHARTWGAPRALAGALRAAGLIEGGERGLALFEEAVGVVESSPAKLEHAKSRTELGAALRDVHNLECPDEPAWRRDVVGSLRATGAARHRRRRMLPEFLVEQIDEYVAPPSDVRCLVHVDHIFVRDGQLVRRVVQTGPVSAGFLEIRSGLNGGEQILTGGVESPTEGMRVKVPKGP